MPTERTDWLKPSPHSKGLDPLGVQALSITIYGRLLPGITNVTDRARYYSFYPWVIRAFDKSRPDMTLSDWVRRSDCLFTMIGIRHAYLQPAADKDRHYRALVGNSVLTRGLQKLQDGDELDLTDFTVLRDTPERYFMNRFGGLGQYYIGTFGNLGLMTREGHFKNIEEAGIPLAEAFESFVDSDLFMQTVISGKITASVLDALSGFCPCRLVESENEHEALLDIFFARRALVADPGKWRDDTGSQRRNTLKMLLCWIRSMEACEKPEGYSDQDAFRACVYTSTLPDGQAWFLPDEELEIVRRQWQVYQKHEIFSAAVQSIFWAALHLLSETSAPLFMAEDFKGYFSKHAIVKKAADELGGHDFTFACGHVRKLLPDVKAWGDAMNNHEMNCVRKMFQSLRKDRQNASAAILAHAGWLLLTLLVRDDTETGAYDPLPQTGILGQDDFFHPLHLENLRQNAASLWRPMATSDWLAWIAWHWGIEAHLRVARRKLRFQNNDTFHVVPTDYGLVWQEEPDPSYTSPRFNQAVQIMKDLGVVDAQGNRLAVTRLGHDILEGHIS